MVLGAACRPRRSWHQICHSRYQSCHAWHQDLAARGIKAAAAAPCDGAQGLKRASGGSGRQGPPGGSGRLPEAPGGPGGRGSACRCLKGTACAAAVWQRPRQRTRRSLRPPPGGVAAAAQAHTSWLARFPRRCGSGRASALARSSRRCGSGRVSALARSPRRCGSVRGSAPVAAGALHPRSSLVLAAWCRERGTLREETLSGRRTGAMETCHWHGCRVAQKRSLDELASWWRVRETRRRASGVPAPWRRRGDHGRVCSCNSDAASQPGRVWLLAAPDATLRLCRAAGKRRGVGLGSERRRDAACPITAWPSRSRCRVFGVQR